MRILIALCASVALAASAQAETIAYWAQNNNALTGGGFGFEVGDFPQAADVGTGDLTWTGDMTAPGGVFATLQSFSGGGTNSGVNALPGFGTGGSIVPQNGPGGVNNGASIWLSVDTTNYTDIEVSWAQRGTATGFTSREFSYSTDGGATFTSFAFDTGVLPSAWALESYDLSGVTAVEGGPVIFAITVDGGDTGSENGNNRFDDILVSGTLIPEPGSVALVLMGIAAAGAVSMRSRLG